MGENIPIINSDTFVKTITFQITEDCNLKCTYCYQINKSKETLLLDKAKKFIDILIDESYIDGSYVDQKNTKAIIIEFIGGEPLLKAKLIREIVNYFIYKTTKEKHIWAINHLICFISNGVNYFSKDTEKIFKENEGKVSFSISIDGNKELHDKCRVFPNGEGSYDIAVKSATHHLKYYNQDMFTKMTISPDNIEYLYSAIINMFNLGYKYVHSNCIFEYGWNLNHAQYFYTELVKIADYLLDNDLEYSLGVSLFDEYKYRNQFSMENRNYCGSTGHMLCLTPSGIITPCLRFTKSSLGEDIGDFALGDLDNGLGKTEEHKNNINILDSITMTSQSNQECIECPIKAGCGWCTAYNYQETGSPNKRVTYICEMHRATSLANVYFWNKLYKKNNENNRFELCLQKEKALNIISEEEYEMLLELSR